MRSVSKLLCTVAVLYAGVAHAQTAINGRIPASGYYDDNMLFHKTVSAHNGGFVEAPVDPNAYEVGMTRTMDFDAPVNEIKLVTDGVVKVFPISDKTIAITAVAPGDTLLVAYGQDGKFVQKVNVHVEGHLVKVYGGHNADYNATMCSRNGCGRVNTDIAPPSSTAIAVTGRRGNGDIVTVTKTYP